MRQWTVAALVAAILLAALPPLTAQHARPHPRPPWRRAGRAMPAALLPRVNASFAADDPAYAVTALPEEAATLPGGEPGAPPDDDLRPGRRHLRGARRCALVAAARRRRGGSSAPAVAPVMTGQRVEYRRGDVTEWYLNGPLGVEQGFTLAAPQASGDTLALTVMVGAGATPRFEGGAVTLATRRRVGIRASAGDGRDGEATARAAVGHGRRQSRSRRTSRGQRTR